VGTVVPGQTDGVEFPAAIQFGDRGRWGLSRLIAHEVAHMWFYALVGNNQARDPWLDESFATFAQGVMTGEQYMIREDASGTMGRSMMSWAGNGGFSAYLRGVYFQGAAVLLEARRRAGTERFDAALRSYLQQNAHRIATPEALAQAFGGLPEVVELLREHGALDDLAQETDAEPTVRVRTLSPR
jgi:Peptidase family M1 domain